MKELRPLTGRALQSFKHAFCTGGSGFSTEARLKRMRAEAENEEGVNCAGDGEGGSRSRSGELIRLALLASQPVFCSSGGYLQSSDPRAPPVASLCPQLSRVRGCSTELFLF